MAQRPLGCDVSSYQGSSVNWPSLYSAGIAFAWAKATEGTGVIDATYAGNVSRGKAARVLMGSYHFAHPESTTAAVQAAYFWTTAGANIKADGLTLMPMLDVEVFSGVVGATSYADWVNQWCAAIVSAATAAGVVVKPVVYISACHADLLNSTVSQWYNNIADYNGASPSTSNPWTVCADDNVWGAGVWNFWQYNDTASYAGFPGEQPDVDVFNGTAATLASTFVATSVCYTWNPQGATGGNPFTGSLSSTWEGSNWSLNQTGQATPINWMEGKTALFGAHTGNGTPAFTVAMNNNHTVGGIFDGGLTQNACNLTINGTGIMTLSGQAGFYLQNKSDGSLASLTLSNQVTGTGEMVVEGNGQLYLNGTNTFIGGTLLGSGAAWSGTVSFNNNHSFGNGSIVMSASGTGGTLRAEDSSPITLLNAVTLATGTLNIIPGAGGTTFSGPWSLGANTPTIDTGSNPAWTLTISGAISGTGGLTKSDSGALVLTGANIYTGATTVNSGTLTISGGGRLNGGIYAGAIANNGSFIYSGSGAQILSGTVSGGGSVIQNGPGVLILSGVNNYTGVTTLNGGVLSVRNASALGSAGAITFAGGTLQYSSSNQMDYSSRFTAARPYNIDVNGQTVAFRFALGEPIGGSLTLSDTSGGGILKLSAANSYAGATTINGGTLALTTGGSINYSAAISIAAGAVFDVSDLGAYTLSSSTALSASGTSSPAAIKGGGNFNVGAQPILLTYDGSHPALTVSQGTLVLNGNAFTVNGSVLPAGSYVLISQTAGNIASSGSCPVAGTAVGAPGTTAAILVSGGNVVLQIQTVTSTTLGAFSSSTFGQPVTFMASVGPAPSGGSVQFYDNGVALGSPAMISDGSASFTTNTLSVGNHAITASYSGAASFAPSSTSAPSNLLVTLPPNSAPVMINQAVLLSDGALQLGFIGVPGYTYFIQSTPSLNPPVLWTNLSTNTADIHGVFNFVDCNDTNFSSLYYRTVVSP
jgi:autotransporter-associated beta strand protein